MQQKRSQNSGRIIDMKHYTVEITNEALADMEQLYNHIAYVLQAPENAMDQYNRIADAILTLDTMAERIRIMESEENMKRQAGYVPVKRKVSCLFCMKERKFI